MHQVWKVSPLGRIGGLLPAVFGAVVWSMMARPVVAILVAALGLVGWFLAVLRPFVALSDTELVIRNPWGLRRVELSDISRVDVGYSGLTITTTTGSQIVAWAVQKSNLAKWTGRQTRADQVAATINAVVESAGART